MKITVSAKQYRNIWKKAEDKNFPDALVKRDHWIMAQTIACLGGKDCNVKIKKMIEG